MTDDQENEPFENWRVLEDVAENLPMPINELTPYGIRPEPKIDADGVIEGEFQDEDETESLIGKPSGFYCKKCERESLVGDMKCAGCGYGFTFPTIPLWKVEEIYGNLNHTAMTYERWSEEQLRWLQQQRAKRR